MPRIQVLSDLLVNKIAAGEVIERPSSIVKELVENSLDAGATCIEIYVEQGGRKLIRVVDNGVGMERDDLAVCVLPHATSKIRSEDDLFGIQTMGFRGEALPSIGAVSQLRIVSRTPESDEAYKIRMAGGRIEPVTVAAGPVGTTVEVRELFFNVPARQKFLRTPQTEIGHIVEQLAHIALVHPQVEFRLIHNDRPVHHLRPAESMRMRIADFYGAELAGTLLEFHRDERGLKITGYAAPPTESRSNAKWQFIFLNGRFIRDRFIGHAIKEAYRGLIEAHRNPVVFLAIEIDPAAVDVNVHPTKTEVRWRDSNTVYSQVLSAMRDRFLSTDLTPELSTARGHTDGDAAGEGCSRAVGGEEIDEASEARRQQIRQSIADFFKRTTPTMGSGTGGAPSTFSGGGRSFERSGSGYRSSAGFNPMGGAGSDAACCPPGTDVAGDGQMFSVDRGPSGPCEPIAYENVMQIHHSYLIAETSDGLMIVDQHALHERVIFEQLVQQVSRGPLESQRLLLPETVDVRPDQVELIETHAETLRQLGFELSAFGPNTIAVHAMPSILRDGQSGESLRDLLDKLAARESPASPELLMNDLLSLMACKAAVKAGDALSLAEMRTLMAQRHRFERSSNCPHGRPTSLRLSLTDLERQFKRI